MNLSMTVMAARDTVIGTCLHYLVELEFTVGSAFLRISGLKEAAAAAATVIVGFVRRHFDDILCSDNLLHDIAQVIGNGIPISLAHDLTGVLDGKLDFALFIPVGIYLQAALTDPFGVILIN